MPLQEVLLLIGKTIFCYFFLFAVLRLMGKREVGEISTFDMVVFLVMSELFSLSLNDIHTPLWHSIFPILVIVALQIITALLSMKSKKVRRVMEGQISYLIIHGEIQQDELKKNRYTIDDLLMQLRLKDIQTPEDVAFAMLEGNGNFSVIQEKDCKIAFPEPIITDGKLNRRAMRYLHLEEKDIYRELVRQNFSKVEEVYLGLVLQQGVLLIAKKSQSNINKVQ